MTRSILLTSSFALMAGACAGRAETRPAGVPPSFMAATRVEPSPVREPPPGAVMAALAAEPQRGRSSPRSRRARRAPSGGGTVDDANRSATREPSRQGYVNAAQVYAWSQGALFRLYAAPERVSDIALQAGETVISVAAGDTARWVIGDTTSGSGAARRTHILVKPSATALRTNLVITTDRRVYHVELESRAAGAMASISWTYPQDELLALSRPGVADTAAPVAGGVAVDALNFGYRISGDRPPWRPLRAFDDGSQVFIEFPAGLEAGEAPPLFVTGASGGAEMVNYRVRGRYYVVDRLFEAAELRLGERRQQVVRIARERAKNQRRGGRDER